MIETYSPEDVKQLTFFSNAVTSATSLEVILEESRADVLTVYMGEGQDRRTVLLDKGYIKDMKKIAFDRYIHLADRGMKVEALTVLMECGVYQSVNRERLMEIDKEYGL